MNHIDKKNIRTTNPKIVINENMKEHGSDTYFVGKAEASKKIIEKYGLPKQLVTGKK